MFKKPALVALFSFIVATSKLPILIGVPIICCSDKGDSLVESEGDEQDTNKITISKAFKIKVLFAFIIKVLS